MKRKLILALCIGLLLYLLTGFLVAPWILRTQAEQRLAEALDRSVTIETLRLNPLTFSLSVRGLSVTDHDGAELAGWDEFYGRYSLSSPFRRAWTFATLHFVNPRLRLVLDESGTLNLADLLAASTPAPDAAPAEPAPPSGPASLPAIRIQRLVVENGRVDFSDRSRRLPFDTHVGPFTFHLSEFTTRPGDGSPYAFEGITGAGETFLWSGTISADPPGSEGRIRLSGIDLPRFHPFMNEFATAVVESGKLSLEIDYTVTWDGFAAWSLSDGRILLEDLAIAGPGRDQPSVSLAGLRIEGLAADPITGLLSADQVRLETPRLAAVRLADGAIDVQAWLRPMHPPAEPEAEWDWEIAVKHIALDDAGLQWTDHSTPVPARIEARDWRLRLDGFSSLPGTVMEIEAEGGVGEGARLDLSGTAAIDPLMAELAIESSNLPLALATPYLRGRVSADLHTGRLQADGTLRATVTSLGTPAFQWEGDLAVHDLNLNEADRDAEVARATAIAFENLRLDTAAPSVAIATLRLTEPALFLSLHPEEGLNLLRLLPTSAQDPETAPEAAPGSPRPLVTIDRVTLEEMRIDFEDQSVSPRTTQRLTGIEGTIEGLSSEQLARADVDLRGGLDGIEAFTIRGQINPLAEDLYSDLAIEVRGVDLVPFTPYAGRFLGFGIDQGRLRMEMNYRLSARDLVGENHIVLDRFYLGDPIESPDALRLPVKLGLAILRDRNERIFLDVPIRGNLDDPEFRFGRVIGQAIGNIMTRAATAPFSIIGALFGRGEELQYLEFASGSAVLKEESLEKIRVLETALHDRPGLSLRIDSRPQPDRDRPGLAAAELDRRIQELETRLGGEAPDRIEDGVLSAEAEARLLTLLYREHFPDETTPPADNENRQPAPAPDPTPRDEDPQTDRPLLQRIWRTLTGAGASAEPAPPRDHAPPAVDADRAADEPPEPAIDPVQLRSRLLTAIELDADAFSDLAQERAAEVRRQLLESGRLAPERIHLGIGQSPLPADPPGPLVLFELE